MPSSSVLILNGPNLDQLGSRQPEIYGNTSLADIERLCQDEAKPLGLTLSFTQSNAETDLISAIHKACKDNTLAIIINAAAYTHTSVAIADALTMFHGPVVEVYLSNTQSREELRHHSYIASIATGVIAGFGAESYTLAIRAVHSLLASQKQKR